MTPHQKAILRAAPRYLYFYREAECGQGIIPDTAKARRWAVEQGGVEFDAFPFHRFDAGGTPRRLGPADFSFRVSHYRYSLATLVARAHEMLRATFERHFQLPDTSFLRATYVDERAIQLDIPYAFFDFDDEIPYFFPEFYKTLSASLRAWTGELGFGEVHIVHPDRVAASNGRRPNGRCAVSMAWDDFRMLAARASGGELGAPRTVVNHSCPYRIDKGMKDDLLGATRRAINQRYRVPRGVAGQGRLWRPLTPLIDASGAVTCSVALSDRAVRCAIKLTAWFRSCGVTEFRRRDALRAVDGSFTLTDGVADALAVLIAHGYLMECPFPPYAYSGKRVSPWFVVNPEVFSMR